MNKTDLFKEELDLIKDNGLKEFIKKCLENAPDYFFTMPASTTGKYHPTYTLGEGGLVRHTKAAVKIANDLLRVEMYEKVVGCKDEVIAALIMHDSIKKGVNGSTYTTTDHPLQASQFAKNVCSEVNYSNIYQINLVCDLIETHMGQWTTDYKTGEDVLQKPRTLAQKFVHLCDYLASRKFLTVDLEA